MSADPTSPQALFAAAQDVARRQGLLGTRLAAMDQCRITKVSYVLNDANGEFIARVPIKQVRAAAQARYRLLNSLHQLKSPGAKTGKWWVQHKMLFRMEPPEVRALAWALSDGRRIPQGAFRPRDWWIGVGLLLLGAIPGVIYLVWAWLRHRQYLADVQGLVVRWHGQHRPDPSDAWFESLGD
jgi:hypothetical protein